jgi:starch-binding outer membrane protein, SusD/RagB family
MLVLGLGLATAACDDDFLTVVPPDQVSDVLFWTQEKDAELSANALYPLNNAVQLVIRMEAASDNGWAQKSFDAWYPVGQGVMNPTHGVPNQIWNNAYQAIRRANEILANIDQIPVINAALKERVIGEAYFHRAYHYNVLAALYGDVPLVLEPINIEDGKTITRTPHEQVVTQVLSDFDQAASRLPRTHTASNYGRATEGAALAFKARAALYAGRWDVAADAANAVMGLALYSLHPEYAELTRYAGDNSAEIILSDRRAQTLRAHNSFGWLGPRSMQGGSDVTPLRGLVDAYQMVDGLPITSSPMFDADAPYENRDPRMYATLLYPMAEFDGEVYNSLPTSPTADRVRNDFNATSTGYQFIKYVDPADRPQPNNSGIDFILMRYADVLLMYAEAQIERNQIDATVYNAINQVRTRAGMPAIPEGLSQAQLRDVVRYERRVELAMEGQRAFDILRWRIAEDVMPGQHYGIDYMEGGVKQTIPADARFFNANRDYLWPIPQRERDLNPNLTQNPGY